MSQFNLRAKIARDGVYEQKMNAESLKEVILHVAEKKDEYTNAEITKDGKLFFVFTLDDKSKIFLGILNEMRTEPKTEDEIIPVPEKKARKSRKKQTEIITA